jgi:hypothetical protein
MVSKDKDIHKKRSQSVRDLAQNKKNAALLRQRVGGTLNTNVRSGNALPDWAIKAPLTPGLFVFLVSILTHFGEYYQ